MFWCSALFPVRVRQFNYCMYSSIVSHLFSTNHNENLSFARTQEYFTHTRTHARSAKHATHTNHLHTHRFSLSCTRFVIIVVQSSRRTIKHSYHEWIMKINNNKIDATWFFVLFAHTYFCFRCADPSNKFQFIAEIIFSLFPLNHHRRIDSLLLIYLMLFSSSVWIWMYPSVCEWCMGLCKINCCSFLLLMMMYYAKCELNRELNRLTMARGKREKLKKKEITSEECVHVVAGE